MRLALLALVILALLADDITAQTASAAVPSVCNDVRYLMANDLTPYDLQNSGSILQPNTPLEAAVEAGSTASFTP